MGRSNKEEKESALKNFFGGLLGKAEKASNDRYNKMKQIESGTYQSKKKKEKK